MWLFLSIIIFILLSFPILYLVLLQLASFLSGPKLDSSRNARLISYIFLIPAHDEENVIKSTINQIKKIDYPDPLVKVVIIADHCTDQTAEIARQAGASVYERNSGLRNGKGAAISWYIKNDLISEPCDAVVIIDADTLVDPKFLTAMNIRIDQGENVIQGKHIIRNPDDGWFPALTWAMFIIDNRIQNFGRTNLGFSAKNMGDSICIRKNVLLQYGWGDGLTDDIQFRHKLLLAGIKIAYEPNAIGRGEAPRYWRQARSQRTRWIKGAYDSNKLFAYKLFIEGIKQRNLALLDGACQAYFPAFSTLVIISALILVIQIMINLIISPIFHNLLLLGWLLFLLFLFSIPFINLALEHAPIKAYLIILSGPIYIIWRSWLMIFSILKKRQITWIRTSHGKKV